MANDGVFLFGGVALGYKKDVRAEGLLMPVCCIFFCDFLSHLA